MLLRVHALPTEEAVFSPIAGGFAVFPVDSVAGGLRVLISLAGIAGTSMSRKSFELLFLRDGWPAPVGHRRAKFLRTLRSPAAILPGEFRRTNVPGAGSLISLCRA